MPPTAPLLVLALLVAPLAKAEPLRVAVAANFRAAAEQLGAAYGAATGVELRISSAATGALYTQIRHGAPFDLFLAADAERPRRLAASGHGVAGTRRCYARGELVLAGDPPGLARLADPQTSLAMANPRTAPYGAAAAAVLARPDFAHPERRIVRGTSVLQAWQFYASGAADLALVARSVVPAGAEAVPVPADWYPPIEQQGIVVAASPRRQTAAAFLAFLAGAREQLRAAGYAPCS